MTQRNKNIQKQNTLHEPAAALMTDPRLLVLMGTALIVAAVIFVYSPALNGGFLLDDDILLTGNQLIKAPDGPYRFWFTTEPPDYWPMTNTSLWIEWRLWGMNSTGYHVTNVVLHIAACLLIWAILWKLSIPGAFLAAMIFAVHPVNVASVAWISQRKNVLAMLFFLLSIWCYLNMEIQSSSQPAYASRSPSRPSTIWYWLSLLMFVLAMLSKGSVAVLPVLLLGIIWWLRPLTKRDLACILPFFLVALILTERNLWFQRHGTGAMFRDVDFAQRILGAGGVVWFYIYKALLPINLVLIYPQWDIQTKSIIWWLPLLAVVIVTAILWRYRNGWSRPFLFAWGFFCAALVPVMGLTDVGFMMYSLVSDHYQHIAIIGVIALAAAGWSIWRTRTTKPYRWMTFATAIVATGILTLLAWQQSHIYSSAETLYRAILLKNPDSWLAHNNLGQALSQLGQPEEAAKHYRQSLQLNPTYFAAHNNLGHILINEGQPEKAIEHFKLAQQFKPNSPDAYINLGNAFTRIGNPQEAIKYFTLALKVKPNSAEAHYNFGNTLVGIGRSDLAIDHYKHALQIKPDYTLAYANLAAAYAKTNQASEAIATAQKALDLARSQNQSAVAKQIEDWLTSYQAQQNNK